MRSAEGMAVCLDGLVTSRLSAVSTVSLPFPVTISILLDWVNIRNPETSSIDLVPGIFNWKRINFVLSKHKMIRDEPNNNSI